MIWFIITSIGYFDNWNSSRNRSKLAIILAMMVILLVVIVIVVIGI